MIFDLANAGPELRDLRELRGVSRAALARRVAARTGANARTLESQLWAWETGKTTPTPRNLADCLAALNFRVDVRDAPPARRRLLWALGAIAKLPTIDVVHPVGCDGMVDAHPQEVAAEVGPALLAHAYQETPA
jgi:transcriptional regulator with XRE-family HTH domain